MQQLAVSYIANGYWFYVTGTIPEAKEPRAVDAKLIAQYGIDVSRWTRCRRKRAGLANVQFLRHARFFVVLATHGDHPFFAAEAARLRDVREHPVHFAGYAIGCRRGRDGRRYHASVRISRKRHRALKAHFAAIAVQRSADLGRQLRGLPFRPFAPVRAQLRELLRAVNRRRQAAGLELVPRDVLRRRRRPVRPFGAEESSAPAATGKIIVPESPPPTTGFMECALCTWTNDGRVALLARFHAG